MLKFIVVGTLRCGTSYTAQLLNRMGLACGHGWVYTPDRVRRYPGVELLGDAGPLAAPSARGFPGLVLHQVRHPLKMIGSLLGAYPDRHALARGSAGAFLSRHFALGDDPLDNALRYYVAWNSLCERHNGYLRYRVEDLDAGLLARIAELVGRPVAADAASRVLEAVPTDARTFYNARRLDWADLPAGPSADALLRMAARYGYRVPATLPGPGAAVATA
jgi:hypothetical protein